MAEGSKENNLCSWHGEKITNLEHEVFGNGKPGLKTTVTRIAEHVKLLLWINCIIFGTMLTAFVVAFSKYVLK